MEQSKPTSESDELVKIIRATIQLMQREAKKGYGQVKKRGRTPENEEKH